MRRFLLNGVLFAVAVLLAIGVSLVGASADDAIKTMDKAKAVDKAKTAAKTKTSTKPAVLGAKVDINSASQAELEKLPGVGAVTAKKIIDGRPYTSAADLSKAGLSSKVIEKIQPFVAVGTTPVAAPVVVPKVSVPKASVPANPAAAKAVKQVQPPAGSGMVWVNPDSKIYHKSGSTWYGKTKQGTYMTESEAIKAGYRESKQGGK
ncbi:ComEA family DNA-binding protein [Geomonas diazotrophica]|uniref:ComEA family DNA-binding protein n=1 Tax=Geomonas diazotrophica TaxID=2843197 RepID=UPI001F35D9AD|nr:helix-hairpin-helix domain-containing protein [Geomonas diazotrophica]